MVCLCQRKRYEVSAKWCERCAFLDECLERAIEEQEPWNEDDDRWHVTAEYENVYRANVLRALHSEIPDPWIVLMKSLQLCAGSILQDRGDGRTWFRFPLRSSQLASFHNEHWCVDGEWRQPGQSAGPFYHNTSFSSLISSNDCAPNSSGIMYEGLRYGVCTHGKCRGVNFYTDGGLETFAGSTGWVQLEINVTKATKIKSGRAHRYCIIGPPGEKCSFVSLSALLIPFEEVPVALRFW